jgi:hypothetical protein
VVVDLDKDTQMLVDLHQIILDQINKELLDIILLQQTLVVAVVVLELLLTRLHMNNKMVVMV